MSLPDWELSPEETRRVQATLRDDERVVHVWRPKRGMPPVDAIIHVGEGLLIAGILAYMAYDIGAALRNMAMLFALPFWLLVLVQLSAPLRYRWRMGRTLYLLTDRRAVVFEQQYLWRNRCVCRPLVPGLVKEVEREDDASGSLVFDYETRWVLHPRIRRQPQPMGFLAVPQVEQVLEKVNAQVAAVTPGAASAVAEDRETPPPEQNGVLFFMIFGGLFAAFASVFLVIGLNRMNTVRDLESRGVQATATVLKVNEHIHSIGRGRTSTTYAPVLRFTDTAGVQQEIESSFGSSDYNFPIGQQVTIRYMPDSPSTLCIVDDSAPPGTILALVGGIFVLIGLGIFAIGLKWRQHNRDIERETKDSTPCIGDTKQRWS